MKLRPEGLKADTVDMISAVSKEIAGRIKALKGRKAPKKASEVDLKRFNEGIAQEMVDIEHQKFLAVKKIYMFWLNHEIKESVGCLGALGVMDKKLKEKGAGMEEAKDA